MLSKVEYEWFLEDEPSTAPLYAARAVLPYLVTGNVRGANQTLLLFTAKLASSPQGASLGVQEVSSTQSDLRVHPSLPLLNFLGLLLLAIQRGAPDLFRQLKGHYAQQLRDTAEGTWDEDLAQIGQMYFGIKIPSQTNPLFDMMGSLLMGGGGGGGNTARSRTPRQVGAQAPAPPQLD